MTYCRGKLPGKILSYTVLTISNAFNQVIVFNCIYIFILLKLNVFCNAVKHWITLIVLCCQTSYNDIKFSYSFSKVFLYILNKIQLNRAK